MKYLHWTLTKTKDLSKVLQKNLTSNETNMARAFSCHVSKKGLSYIVDFGQVKCQS